MATKRTAWPCPPIVNRAKEMMRRWVRRGCIISLVRRSLSGAPSRRPGPAPPAPARHQRDGHRRPFDLHAISFGRGAGGRHRRPRRRRRVGDSGEERVQAAPPAASPWRRGGHHQETINAASSASSAYMSSLLVVCSVHQLVHQLVHLLSLPRVLSTLLLMSLRCRVLPHLCSPRRRVGVSAAC